MLDFFAKALLIAVAACFALYSGQSANAQTACTEQSQAANLTALADGGAPGNITPRKMRDVVCSSVNKTNASDGAVTATGSTTARTLGARFSDVINVKDYGAVGDGTATDTAAIRLALAAVPASGAQVFFPKGTYKINGMMTLPSNVHLYGPEATILSAAGNAWESGAGITSAFYSVGSNITIEGMHWSFPYGNATYGGAYAHILEFVGTTRVVIKDNVSDGGANFSSFQGGSDSLVIGNRATNVSNACYDHWGGAQDARVIGNYCSVWSGGGVGTSGINFTGINTNQTAANSRGFIATDNVIYVHNAVGSAGITVNGHATGGTDDVSIISHNQIFVNNVSAWGILVLGQAHHGIISENYIQGGTTAVGNYSAIGVFGPPATHWQILNNVVNNWQAGAAGIFQNSTAGGSLLFNKAYSSSSPLIGVTVATTQQIGNDTGTGVLSMPSANITTANITTLAAGTATFDAFSTTNGATFGWNGSGGSPLSVNGATGTSKVIYGQTAGVNRWAILPGDNVTESGSNAGSNFGIYGFTDAGDWPAAASLGITRSTGVVTIQKLNLAALPTSCSGQPSKTIWNNSGVLNICP